MRAVCYTDKEQNYIRLATKPTAPSPRKSAERLTLPSQNTFNKKKRIAKKRWPCVFPVQKTA